MNRRLPAFFGIFLIFVVGAGLLVFQRQHIKKHLPLITAEFAAADAEGPAILALIGLPEGATPHEEGAKTYPGESRNSMWRGAKLRIRWERSWVLPGNHDKNDVWFSKRLEETGWRPFTVGVPSTVERSFWRDKWLFTIQHRADFSTDRNPTVRQALVLEWDYWHDLGR